MAVIVDGATTDHEHDHGGFTEHETRVRLFAFFPLSALIMHPCLNGPESAGLVNPVQFCDLAKRVIHSTNYVRRTQMVCKIELRTLDKFDTRHDVGVH